MDSPANSLIDVFKGFPVREADNRRSNRRVYDIKKLWSRSKEILHLDSLGYKGTEIADMLNIDRGTVSATLNSSLGKQAQLAIRNDRDDEYQAMRESIMELTWKALEVYEEILNDPVESTKLRKETADTVSLDLAGLRTPTKIQTMNAHTTLTPEELEDFKKRGFEAAKASGKLVEVEDEKV